jgi:CRISPR-associated protein Cmr1
VAPFDVTIELRCRALGDQRALLLAALRAIGLLGGLGARSRRGYGSLVLRGLSCDGAPSWSPARSIEDLEREIASLVAAAASARELPDYTALSARTRIVLVPATSGEKSPLQMLDRVGREMMRYRSWGHEGRVFGNDSEKNFRGDHDLMKQDPQLRRRHPARVVFGLPHNYGKPLENRVDPADPDDGDRRASPLLIHVHDCDAGPIAVLSFLPARFLSRGNRAKINVGGKAVPIASDDELWRPIERLLTRFRAGPPERVESFGHAKEVRWP